MIRTIFSILTVCCAGAVAVPAGAQTAQAPQTLTLAQAHSIAVQNEPRLLSAQYQAAAARAITSEERSAYYPQVFGDLTGADAENNSRIAAGALNNPIIYTRYANGIEATQLVTDFGRTHSRVASANFEAKSQQQSAEATRADVLLNVDQAYFRALAAQAVLKVAQQDVDARQAVADQVGELAKNKLRSSLDVSFANVNLAQGKLFLIQARNEFQAAEAGLSLALGDTNGGAYQLQDEPLPPAPTGDVAALIAQAYQQRPELAGSRFHVQSAQEHSRAEAELWLPTLSAAGAAGLTPVREAPLDDRYAAAGFNLSIPIFNGRLYEARHAEASAEESAANQDMIELQDQIAHDVRVAWLNANTAHDRLAVTQELLDQATQSLQLAQARYDLGLSSIVELSQAELNQTQAQVSNAQANYDFQTAISALSFAVGTLR